MKQTLCIRYNDSYCTYLFIFLMEAGMDFYQDSLPENSAIKILVSRLYTLPTAETLTGKNARAWVSMVLHLKK